MKCPYCGSTEHKVVDKRDTPDALATRRRRECLTCQKRFTTYERVEHVEIIVIKDLSRVPFDRQKILNGLTKACEKRPVSFEQIQEMVTSIESTIRSMDTVEVTTKQIGELVMKQLKRVDKVAYIRFASVYKQFEDIEEFQEELMKLLKKA